MLVINQDILANLDNGKTVVVLHGCNCFHTMGAGIARYLSNQFPQVMEADKATIYGDKSKLGLYSVATINPNLYVVNCYSQYRYGRNRVHADKNAIRRCLVLLRANLLTNFMSLEALDVRAPKIGCGLAGGKWSEIEAIFDECFPEITIYQK